MKIKARVNMQGSWAVMEITLENLRVGSHVTLKIRRKETIMAVMIGLGKKKNRWKEFGR